MVKRAGRSTLNQRSGVLTGPRSSVHLVCEGTRRCSENGAELVGLLESERRIERARVGGRESPGGREQRRHRRARVRGAKIVRPSPRRGRRGSMPTNAEVPACLWYPASAPTWRTPVTQT